MPQPSPEAAMTLHEQKAYDEALRRINECHSAGETKLDLSGLELTRVPPEIKKLALLEELRLRKNRLTAFPPEACTLTSLTHLILSQNHLSDLPSEIGNLVRLKIFYVTANQLRDLPREIGNLVALEELLLRDNRIAALPSEIGKLTSLKELWLQDNELTVLPIEMANLALSSFSISDNPLQDPPISIAVQGLDAIRRYFADKTSSGVQTLWRSKLMLVGEGRIGKSELRHRLMKRAYGTAKSTEVVEIETVPLPHPNRQGVTMELRCWDFGGQEIYHATHQFFLTGRSLFIFCFEAGKDWEPGKPYYWLDKIAAVAPDAPVIIVATKCDERPAPALPWDDLKKRYPNLVGDGCFQITTKEKERKDQIGDGVAELIACLQTVASDRTKLPLMGEELPVSWVKGMDAVTNHPSDHYLKRDEFFALLDGAGVPKESHHTVATMLRDLGEILYYCEDKDGPLCDWVIIKPTWVTHAAARVLESVDVEKHQGILTHHEMSKVWAKYPELMHPVLLELLERYDLTYKIPEDRDDRSLIVEKLPKDEVAAPDSWDRLKPSPDNSNREMEMTFQLRSMQAGIPTWFIARKHYYTLHHHWAYGVYFGDNRHAPRHVALVRVSTDPKNPHVHLAVRGPFPQTFFAVMKEGLEASIRDRYPKLIETQTIPCCCQDEIPNAAPCTHGFNYERLLERMAKGKPTAECDVSQEDVSVAKLLFGYDAPVDATLQELKRLHATVNEFKIQLRASFDYLYSDLQKNAETHCPNYFVIWKTAKGKAFRVPMKLSLVCQHPGEEHLVCPPEEPYSLDAMKDFLRNATPYLRRMSEFLKYAKLAGLPLVKEWDKEIGEAVGDVQEGINEMLEDFEVIAEKGETPALLAANIDERSNETREKQVAGAALREFRALLRKLDPEDRWQGLEKRRSNQTGNYLWVCSRHGRSGDYKG